MQLNKVDEFMFDVVAQATVVLCGAIVLTIAAVQLPFYLLLRRN